ncbi:MAG: hypothetical protein RH917_16010 [Lacipirellulaceae bacterium]
MASSRSRGDRRRRVLTDETRSQSSNLATSSSSADDAVETPRYGAQANIENHPQVTDYVPRQRRSVMLVLTLLVGVTVGAAFLIQKSELVASKLPAISATQLTQQVSGGVVSWLSAALLLLTTFYLRIVYMLRRHRVDDDRGRYRVWWWAAAATVLMSFNAVVGINSMAADSLASLTGWSFTASGAEWWIIPTVLFGSWIGVRVLLEMRESRLAFLAGITAVACYVANFAVALSWMPSVLAEWSVAISAVLAATGHIFAFGATALFSRHVVLDVQGLIEAPIRKSKESAPAEAASEVEPETIKLSETKAASANQGRKAKEKSKPAAKKEESSASQWVDGSEPETYEDERPRKLSKAERKRLRKQKANRRAA